MSRKRTEAQVISDSTHRLQLQQSTLNLLRFKPIDEVIPEVEESPDNETW
jgi:hypothetical protein